MSIIPFKHPSQNQTASQHTPAYDLSLEELWVLMQKNNELVFLPVDGCDRCAELLKQEWVHDVSIPFIADYDLTKKIIRPHYPNFHFFKSTQFVGIVYADIDMETFYSYRKEIFAEKERG